MLSGLLIYIYTHERIFSYLCTHIHIDTHAHSHIHIYLSICMIFLLLFYKFNIFRFFSSGIEIYLMCRRIIKLDTLNTIIFMSINIDIKNKKEKERSNKLFLYMSIYYSSSIQFLKIKTK